MIVWITKEAAGMPCNQRAEVLEVVGGFLRVKLCGGKEVVLVAPSETCGVEFSEELSLDYKATITRRRSEG